MQVYELTNQEKDFKNSLWKDGSFLTGMLESETYSYLNGIKWS